MIISFKKQQFVIFFLICFYSFGQNDEKLLMTHDSIVKLENSLLSNGKFYSNTFKVNNNKHVYFLSDDFVIGNVDYFENKFYNVYIKYDLFLDEIIFTPNHLNKNNGIILINDKVSSFSLHNKTFVNCESIKNNLGLRGYIENNVECENFIFYVKHKKKSRQIEKENKLYYEFNLEQEFYLSNKKEIFKIKSKKSIIKVFPEYKDKINAFYKEFFSSKKDNYSFYQMLFENLRHS